MIKIDTENYNQEEIIQALKNKTITEVLKDYNLTWQELIYIQTQKSLNTNTKPTYITRTRKNTYKVNKTIDKKMRNYGEYHNRTDAETIVKELKKHYWNKEQLPIIKKTHNIQEVGEQTI